MINFEQAPQFGRIDGLKAALTMLHSIKPENALIVETGTTRGSLGGGISGDGWATVLFGWYCQNHASRICTIDIQAEAIEECKELTKDYAQVITYEVGNSVEVIKNKIHQHIDLLYLDSANDPQITLDELKAAEPLLSEKSIIYIDDTSLIQKRPGGVCKGILAHQYLFEKGWKKVFDNGDQIIMTFDGLRPNFLSRFIVSLKTMYFYKRAIRRGAI